MLQVTKGRGRQMLQAFHLLNFYLLRHINVNTCLIWLLNFPAMDSWKSRCDRKNTQIVIWRN